MNQHNAGSSASAIHQMDQSIAAVREFAHKLGVFYGELIASGVPEQTASGLSMHYITTIFDGVRKNAPPPDAR